MATEYKDVIRVHDTEANCLSILRNKQLGKGTDGQNRIVMKDSSGNPYYWTADGYDATYGDITVGEYIYHDGDLSTYIRFTAGSFEVSAGGVTMLTTETGILSIPNPVLIGETVYPYTGGDFGDYLSVGFSGGVSWGNNETAGNITVGSDSFTDANISFPIYYNVVGRVVTIKFIGTTGTSNQVHFRFTNWPSYLMPDTGDASTAIPTYYVFFDNGAYTTGGSIHLEFDSVNDRAELKYWDGSAAGWTNTGTKGINHAFTCTYALT